MLCRTDPHDYVRALSSLLVYAKLDMCAETSGTLRNNPFSLQLMNVLSAINLFRRKEFPYYPLFFFFSFFFFFFFCVPLLYAE